MSNYSLIHYGSVNHEISICQFSLPRTSSEMSALEKYLQVQQDSVPCRVRAKRGCATHPRSIAERVRQTVLFFPLNEVFPVMLDFLYMHPDRENMLALVYVYTMHHILLPNIFTIGLGF